MEVFKMKGFVKVLNEKGTKFAALVSGVTGCMAVTMIGHCTEDATVTAMGTAMGTIKDNIIAALGVVAPVALGIFGAFLVWKYGQKFFKGIAK
jgi:hypothetical protein